MPERTDNKPFSLRRVCQLLVNLRMIRILEISGISFNLPNDPVNFMHSKATETIKTKEGQFYREAKYSRILPSLPV